MANSTTESSNTSLNRIANTALLSNVQINIAIMCEELPTQFIETLEFLNLKECAQYTKKSC